MSRTMDVCLTGLAKMWDGDEEVRQRVREAGTLLHAETGQKILVKTASLNFSVLHPVVSLMSQVASAEEGQVAPSPAVEDLRAEVKTLFELNQKSFDFEGVDKMAWAVRKFIAFLKLKIRKREVSLEPSRTCVRKLCFHGGVKLYTHGLLIQVVLKKNATLSA